MTTTYYLFIHRSTDTTNGQLVGETEPLLLGWYLNHNSYPRMPAEIYEEMPGSPIFECILKLLEFDEAWAVELIEVDDYGHGHMSCRSHAAVRDPENPRKGTYKMLGIFPHHDESGKFTGLEHDTVGKPTSYMLPSTKELFRVWLIAEKVCRKEREEGLWRAMRRAVESANPFKRVSLPSQDLEDLAARIYRITGGNSRLNAWILQLLGPIPNLLETLEARFEPGDMESVDAFFFEHTFGGRLNVQSLKGAIEAPAA